MHLLFPAVYQEREENDKCNLGKGKVTRRDGNFNSEFLYGVLMAKDMSSSGATLEKLHTCHFLFKMKILTFFYVFETVFEMHLHPTCM